jgi:hypothetical protein
MRSWFFGSTFLTIDTLGDSYSIIVPVLEQWSDTVGSRSIRGD